MLNLNQATIYSLLCAILPCSIYIGIQKKRKHKIPILPIIIFVLYLWQVYDLTGAGGLSDILYVPDGAINHSIIKANINLIPFNTIDITFFLNIIMLIPLGFLVPLIWKDYRKWNKTILLGAGFSLMIEISQLVTTRATDINDLIANTLGALIGYVIWKVFFRNYLKEPVNGNMDVIWYIVLSFLGMFFLYYPFWFYDKIAINF